MKRLYLIILSFALLVISCKPSARYRSNHENPETEERSGYNIIESSNLNDYIRQWLNSPYKYGGMSKKGVDCSGFTSRMMEDVYNFQIPRTAEEQYENGRKISDGRMRAGDLVFFRNVRGKGIDHVGVYLGNKSFAHASNNAGVIISDLDEDYYRKRYVGACRYLD